MVIYIMNCVWVHKTHTVQKMMYHKHNKIITKNIINHDLRHGPLMTSVYECIHNVHTVQKMMYHKDNKIGTTNTTKNDLMHHDQCHGLLVRSAVFSFLRVLTVLGWFSPSVARFILNALLYNEIARSCSPFS